MKIAIDSRPLQTRYARHGIGTVTRNLLSHLIQSRCSTSLILCGKSVFQPLLCSDYRMLKRPASHDWFWEQVQWPIDLLRMKAGILHSTVSLGMVREIGLPLVSPAKRIATVHDLTVLHMPELAPHARMRSFRIQKSAVRRSDLVIVPSEFVKNDVVTMLKVEEKNVRVVRWATDEAIAAAFDNRIPATAETGPFILAMGEEANKNISAVIKVFELLAEKGFAGKLRVIGSLKNQTAAVRQQHAGCPVRERIIFTGSISIEQVVENYATASFFLFPSLHEGFGLPVLEAMYCGTPVLTSNTSSLPETGGNAAAYCDAANIGSTVEAAERIMKDDVYRRDLVEKGNRHARSRSWSEAAEMVISMYEELGWKKNNPNENK
jgi:glycosyltransferase involved in cell wall biosynthesis